MKMKKKTTFLLCLTLAAVFVLSACGSGGSGSGSDAGDDAVSYAVSSPSDFPGHSIAVQTATTAADSIDELYPGGAEDVTVNRYEKVTQCFDDLALGRVDAVYVDSVVAAYYIVDSDEYERTWLGEEPEPMAVCLAKESEALAAAVDAAIDTMFFDGSMGDIAVKNFGEDFAEGLRSVTEAPAIPTDFSTMSEGKLTVGVEVSYPPMEYLTDDAKEYIGFDIDVAKKIGEILGLDVVFVNTAWDGIFAGLEKGEYDCIISAVSITPDRLEKYILTEPYVANRLCVVVKTS
jgi:ABC-type amino acid transport substrate-binding protein